MPEMFRVRINWTGFVGGPGYTNLHFEPTAGGAIDQSIVDAAVTKVDAFLNTLRPSFPTAVITGVDPMVQEVDEVTGNLEAFYTATPAAAAAGTDNLVYSAVSGAVINWYTNDVRNGRRVRGRTFLVPLGGNQYDFNGTLGQSRVVTFSNAAAALSDDSVAARLVVWKRPDPAPSLPNGGAYNVTAYTVPDKAAMLTSRRD